VTPFDIEGETGILYSSPSWIPEYLPHVPSQNLEEVIITVKFSCSTRPTVLSMEGCPERIDKTFSDSRFTKLKRVLINLVGQSECLDEPDWAATMFRREMPRLAEKSLLFINDEIIPVRRPFSSHPPCLMSGCDVD
jgi:hypothetical protein